MSKDEFDMAMKLRHGRTIKQGDSIYINNTHIVKSNVGKMDGGEFFPLVSVFSVLEEGIYVKPMLSGIMHKRTLIPFHDLLIIFKDFENG